MKCEETPRARKFSLPTGPDDGNPVVYRSIPNHPGYQLGSDRSVWSNHLEDGAPLDGFRWMLPDIRYDLGAVVILRRDNKRGAVRMPVDLLMSRLFPPKAAHGKGEQRVTEGDGLGGLIKLDAAKVAEMRRLKAEGWGYPSLQKRFGVSRSTVFYALTGATWRHVVADDEDKPPLAKTS
jgi:hypothetical protein